MSLPRKVLRILLVASVAVGLGYWAGTTTTDVMIQNTIAEYGVREFTEIPEYQGVAFGHMLCGALVFLVVAPLAGWSIWQLTKQSKPTIPR